MSSASAAIVAILPVPPTNIVAAPSAPTITQPAPTAPLVVIDGTTVPVIPPFIRANFGGIGALAAAYTSTSSVSVQGNATGALAAATTVQQPTSAAFGGTGTIGYALVFGAGAIRAVPAQFTATATAAVADAAYICTTTLAVAVNAVRSSLPATFGGTGLLAPQTGPWPTANAAACGLGTLSATTGVYAAFGGTGTLVGNLFAPSGMIKNGDRTGPTTNSWTQIKGWTADTAHFPGSTVSSDALVAQGTKTNATVGVSIAWYPGAAFASNSLAVRIKQNGTPIATSASSANSPVQASAVVRVSAGDTFTVEVQDTSGNAATWPATITGGSSSALQIT